MACTFIKMSSIMPKYEAVGKQRQLSYQKRTERTATYHGIPGASAETHGVHAHAQTANAIVVALELADTLTAKNVPDLDSDLVDAIQTAQVNRVLTLHSKSS